MKTILTFIALIYASLSVFCQVNNFSDWNNVKIFTDTQTDSVKTMKRIQSKVITTNENCKDWVNNPKIITLIKKYAALKGCDAVLVFSCDNDSRLTSSGVIVMYHKEYEFHCVLYSNGKPKFKIEDVQKTVSDYKKFKIIEWIKEQGLWSDKSITSPAKLIKINYGDTISLTINIPQVMAQDYRVMYHNGNQITIHSDKTEQSFIIEPINK